MKLREEGGHCRMRVVLDYLISAFLLLFGLFAVLAGVMAFRQGMFLWGALFLFCAGCILHWFWRAWRVLGKRPN